MSKEDKKREALSHLAGLSGTVPQARKIDAWLGIDSLYGRYQFGSEEGPPNGLIAPKQVATISIAPQALFRGERLFVHRSCASDFVLRSVFVGNRFSGLLLGMQPVITEPFAVDFDELTAIKFGLDEAVQQQKDGDPVPRRPIEITVNKSALEFLGMPFYMPTCEPALHLSFQVENIGKEPRRFLAALYGQALL